MTTLDSLHQASTSQKPAVLRGDAQAWQRRFTTRVVVSDLAAAVVASAVAFAVRLPQLEYALVEYALLTLALPLIWLGAVWACRAYEMRFLGTGPEEFRRIVNAAMYTTAGIAVVSYSTKAEVARGYVLLALPLAAGLTLLGRHLGRRWLYARRRRGECLHRVLLVGHEQGVLDTLQFMRRDRATGMEVVGACLPTGGQRRDLVRRHLAVAGTFDTVARAVELTDADTVAVLACPEMDGPALRRLAWQLEETGTDLLVAPAAMDLAGPRIHIRPVSGMPLLHVEEPEFTGGRRVLKSAVDRVAAAAAVVLLSPVLIAIALAIRVSSQGPVLFRQRRVGRLGREFTMLKFRTMKPDAEARREELLSLNNGAGALFKLREDPRVTPIGRWLRRYSLDELPQLLNVIGGSMSLVGPRPPLASEVQQYDDDMRARRMLVKPGLTGLWQISGRSDLPWDEAVRLDLRYVDNWSLALDLSILARTISAVVRGSGAY